MTAVGQNLTFELVSGNGRWISRGVVFDTSGWHNGPKQLITLACNAHSQARLRRILASGSSSDRLDRLQRSVEHRRLGVQKLRKRVRAKFLLSKLGDWSVLSSEEAG